MTMLMLWAVNAKGSACPECTAALQSEACELDIAQPLELRRYFPSRASDRHSSPIEAAISSIANSINALIDGVGELVLTSAYQAEWR